MNVARARRALRHPPAYICRRLSEEVRRELDRRTIAAARSGRGRLGAANVPGGVVAAERRTAENLDSIAPWPISLELSRSDPQVRRRIEERAERAQVRLIELFGDGPLHVGVPPPWSLDVRSGFGWPRGFHRRIEYVNAERPSDVKVAWELSRLRHLVALAQGAASLGAPKYLQAFDEDLDDWIRANPVGWSVNWTCAMEVALRAVNLICADGILRSADIDADSRGRLVTSLYQHGWFLYRNLEISDVNGNHFLADAVGLVWLGRYLSGVGEASRWLARGRRMVLEAADRHVLRDGLDQEGSLRYHVLVLEMFLTARVVDGQALGAIDPVLRRMLDATAAIADARGRLPNVGDDDGGRVLAFCDAPSSDARRVLAFGGAVLHHDAALRSAGTEWPEDAIWLTGSRPQRALVGASTAVGRLFQDAGIVVLGDRDDHIVVDVGPAGFRGRGGHGHVDAMSFEAMLGGRLAVPDSGTGSYTGDPALRNELRDAPAHTLVVVDELPYARIGDPTRLWAIDGDSVPIVRSLDIQDDRHTLVVEQHLPARDGRARLVRRIEWSPGCLRWRDRIDAPAAASIRQYVQLPGEPCRVGVDAMECDGFLFTFELSGGRLEAVPCRRSSRYGVVEPGFRATVHNTAGQAPLEVQWTVTALSPSVSS